MAQKHVSKVGQKNEQRNERETKASMAEKQRPLLASWPSLEFLLVALKANEMNALIPEFFIH